MIHKLDSSTSFELPNSKSVRIEINQQYEPFNFAYFDFKIEDENVEGSLINASRYPEIDIIAILYNLYNYLTNDSKALLSVDNFHIKIYIDDIIIDFADAFGTILGLRFFRKDKQSAEFKIAELSDSVKNYIAYLSNIIQTYLEHEDEELQSDPNLFIGLTEYEREDTPMESGGSVRLWIELKKSDEIEDLNNLSEDQKINYLTEYIIDQIKVAASELKIKGVEYEVLEPIIKEIVKREVEPNGNSLGKSEIETVAHDFLNYFYNRNSELNGEPINYENYWDEENNPKKLFLELLGQEEELFLVFYSAVVDICNFLIPETSDDDDDNEDLGPRVPEREY